MLASVRSFFRKNFWQAYSRGNEHPFICKTCQKDVVLNSSTLVNFVTRSALQKCELNDNSWPQFVSAIKLNLES